jgi:hypothetical protein
MLVLLAQLHQIATNRRRNANIWRILRFKDFLKCLQRQLNEAYSIRWNGAETETHVFKMAANFREKRTSITTMRAKTYAFAIFATPLISHYPLPLTIALIQTGGHKAMSSILAGPRI